MLMSPLHSALPSTITTAALLHLSPRPVWHCFLLDTSLIQAEGREHCWSALLVLRSLGLPNWAPGPLDGHLLQDTGMW